MLGCAACVTRGLGMGMGGTVPTVHGCAGVRGHARDSTMMTCCRECEQSVGYSVIMIIVCLNAGRRDGRGEELIMRFISGRHGTVRGGDSTGGRGGAGGGGRRPRGESVRFVTDG